MDGIDIYYCNFKSGRVERKWKDGNSCAIEGIVVVDGKIYVANDGLFHKGCFPENVINIYR